MMIIYPNHNFEPKDSIFGLWFPWENLHFLYGQILPGASFAFLEILAKGFLVILVTHAHPLTLGG